MKTGLFARLLLQLALGTWTLFGSLGVCATTEKAVPFVIGEKFEIESKVLDETRTYIIHTPASYKSGKDAYPVLVLQDVEGHFAYTTSAVDMLSGNGRIPPSRPLMRASMPMSSSTSWPASPPASEPPSSCASTSR